MHTMEDEVAGRPLTGLGIASFGTFPPNCSGPAAHGAPKQSRIFTSVVDPFHFDPDPFRGKTDPDSDPS